VIAEREKMPQRPALRIGVREFRGNFFHPWTGAGSILSVIA
jgi:hypothetical protein